MFVFLLSMLGAAVFIGLALCVRHFESMGGTDGYGRGGGGGGRGPGPDVPSKPLAVIDPPLGEIRCSSAEKKTSLLDCVLTRV